MIEREDIYHEPILSTVEQVPHEPGIEHQPRPTETDPVVMAVAVAGLSAVIAGRLLADKMNMKQRFWGQIYDQLGQNEQSSVQ